MQDSMDAMIDHAVGVAHEFQFLPSVPTADWCRTAAHMLSRMGKRHGALVALARMSRGGAHLDEVKAAGLFCDDPSTPPAGVVEAQVAGLHNVAWLPPSAQPRLDGTWAEIFTVAQLREHTRVDLWGMMQRPHVAVAIAPLQPGSEYCLIACVSIDEEEPAMRSAVVAGLRSLAGLLSKLAVRTFGVPKDPIRWISPREREVLDLLIQGMSVREIGQALGRSHHTITDHLKSLHRKLNANSRGELVAKALGGHGRPFGVASENTGQTPSEQS